MKSPEVVPLRADDMIKWLKFRVGATLSSSIGFCRQRGEKVTRAPVSGCGIWLFSHPGPGLLDPEEYKSTSIKMKLVNYVLGRDL